MPHGWTPPTEIEQALAESKRSEDWGGYLRLLAGQLLYIEVEREGKDAAPSRTYPVFEWHPQISGGRIWALYTEGMLPAPDVRVFDCEYLEWFARVWKANYPAMIAVNPGSPCEAFLPSAPPHSAEWARCGQGRTPDKGMRLRGLSVGGPLHGPVAHGLACGGLLCVSNGSLWNAMGWHGGGYSLERERLKE